MTRQTERLVQSTYSDLAPSHHVEEELLANLPAQRARPGLAVPLGIAAVILIGLTIAFTRGGDGDVEVRATNGDAPELNLAKLARPDRGVVPGAKDDVHVKLLFEGGIRVLQDDKWTAVSLEQLGEHLGKVPEERRIVIGVDRAAPWQHLQWIMVVCAEQRLPNLAFAVLDERGKFYNLDATLPTDLGVRHDGRIRPERLRIRVQPKQEKEVPWRGSRALQASAADYYVGKAQFAALPKLLNRLRADLKLDPGLQGEVMAPSRAPFWMVATAMGEFFRAGFGRLDFYGTPLPSNEIRAAPTLPYPGRPRKDGPRLEFALVEGDPKDLPRTVVMLRERARMSGSFTVDELVDTDNGIEWTLWSEEDPKLAQQIVERQGVSLEFHITVERDYPDFEREWALRQKGEKPSRGFQWYPLGDHAKNKYAKGRLPESKQPLVLCRADEYGITKASIHLVSAERATHEIGDSWAVNFQIRKAHQENMAKLTSVSGQYLAIILDGRIHSAPKLQGRLRTHAQITGGFSEPEAKALAVLLQSPALPVRLKLKRR